jgi:hypothetical protein
LAERNLDFRPPILESQPVFTRVGHVLLIVALLAATGAHWTVLQSVAWTTMLADNLRTASLPEAVQRTFDGKHPCSLCKKIDDGKKTQKKSEFPICAKRLEFVSERLVFVFSPPQHFHLVPTHNELACERSHRPPVPPPRNLPA